jgi:hypothetical protein
MPRASFLTSELLQKFLSLDAFFEIKTVAKTENNTIKSFIIVVERV